jgi:hypothetical protein
MTKSNCTLISLNPGFNEFLSRSEWLGAPDAETGVFTIGDRSIIRFLELRITIMPQSVMGYDKPVLSMRYHASLVGGGVWTGGDGPLGMPSVQWQFDGRDDLGTEYECQSGASGFPDSSHTIFDSDISFEPEVPVNASWIEIRFMHWRNPGRPIQIFRAEVPPLGSGKQWGT